VAVPLQGERQRVLIARALMARPRLLILDEPCAGLDPIAREDFLNFLGGLARRNNAPAFVLVTHHVEEISPCFRAHALLLRAGRAVAAGPLPTTLTAPQLSATFDAPLRLRRRAGRYALGFPAADLNPVAESLDILGLASPWTYVSLFLAASLLMLWRFEALLRSGLEGTAVGTLVMPYCSGLGNLLLVAIVARRGEPFRRHPHQLPRQQSDQPHRPPCVARALLGS